MWILLSVVPTQLLSFKQLWFRRETAAICTCSFWSINIRIASSWRKNSFLATHIYISYRINNKTFYTVMLYVWNPFLWEYLENTKLHVWVKWNCRKIFEVLDFISLYLRKNAYFFQNFSYFASWFIVFKKIYKIFWALTVVPAQNHVILLGLAHKLCNACSSSS